MPFDPTIFKAYDIRGVYPDQFDEATAERIGRAVVTLLKADRVLVGRDMRTSSPALRDALVRGIRAQGASVTDIGLCSSPMFYWATQLYPAGVMVTASHNPGRYNGFKICKDGAFPVCEISGMNELKQLVTGGQFTDAPHQGSCEERNRLDDFLTFNLSFLTTDQPFKIVVDAANGMGGYVYAALMKRLPASIAMIPMFFEPDGSFPNHEANPLKPETCRQLQERVIAEKADLGVALDGDEDRLFFIDDTGAYVAADFTTALIAEEVLIEHPGATILYGINQSRMVPEIIAAAGGKPVMNRVGHAFYKVSMVKEHAAWGGEHSGHFFNAEQQNTENTMINLFRLLNLLGKRGKKLSELTAPLKRYAKIPETNFEVAEPKAMIEALRDRYVPQAISHTTMDGLRVDFADWWFCVRPSNTEPLLRLNMEADTPALLEQKLAELTTLIRG